MTRPTDPRFAPRGGSSDIEQGAHFAPKFDADGLIAAIVVDHASGDVAMFAWMTAETLALSIETGEAHFWSRSRRKVWRKGEESGNSLRIVEMRTDCDQDAVLVRVEIRGGGVACHTGARSCFYRRIEMPPREGEKFALV
jgi:phosphoribosyl-AMP cyclohydrolase